MPKININWLGLAGAILIILLIAISISIPWWQLQVGEELIKANVSPLYTNFDFIGNSFTIPLLLALNITSIILLTAGAITMLIYALKPNLPYAKQLLGFGYKKPLYAVITFTITLIIITLVVKSVWGIDIPLIGKTTTTLPTNLTQNTTINVQLQAGFQWPYLIAIVAAILCIAAKLYDKKINPPTPKQPTTPTTTDNTPQQPPNNPTQNQRPPNPT